MFVKYYAPPEATKSKTVIFSLKVNKVKATRSLILVLIDKAS